MLKIIQNQAELITFAKQVVNIAAKNNIDVRIFGGIAVHIHCASNDISYTNQQTSKDIDFVAKIEQLNKVDAFLKQIKFEWIDTPEFSTNGEHRIYEGLKEDFGISIKLDVYFGSLSFNHIIPLPYFDTHNKYTIPLTQLLLSKLAIVELTQKDIYDIFLILTNHEIDTLNDKEVIRKDLLLSVWCNGFKGWGIAKTCEKNLVLLQSPSTYDNIKIYNHELLQYKVQVLLNLICHSKKSITWKIRNVLGERFMYYKDANPAL